MELQPQALSTFCFEIELKLAILCQSPAVLGLWVYVTTLVCVDFLGLNYVVLHECLLQSDCIVYVTFTVSHRKNNYYT